MEYLVNPTTPQDKRDCCFLGNKIECIANACAQCRDLCGIKCTELCGGQFLCTCQNGSYVWQIEIKKDRDISLSF